MQISIITPSQTIETEGRELHILTLAGGMGIHKGHVSLVTPLLGGPVTIHDQAKAEVYVVTPGTASITPEGVKIFTESAVSAHDLEEKELEKEIKEYTELHQKSHDTHELAKITAILERKTIQLEAAKKKK
jgi:ATP synthase F1 epsilon subunit